MINIKVYIIKGNSQKIEYAGTLSKNKPNSSTFKTRRITLRNNNNNPINSCNNNHWK